MAGKKPFFGRLFRVLSCVFSLPTSEICHKDATVVLQEPPHPPGVRQLKISLAYGDSRNPTDKRPPVVNLAKFPEARIWTAPHYWREALFRSPIGIWDPAYCASSNAQSLAMCERTILNGPIDVPRPPSYRSGWGRLPRKIISHDEYSTELRPLRVFLSYGGET